MNNISFNNNFYKNYIRSASKHHLYLTILPTEQCNFRCVYCYEKFEKGNMNPEVINGIKNLIAASSSDLKNLHISFFGGEPTLNHKAMLDLSKHAKSLSDKHRFTYNAHVTTNAFIIDKSMFIEFLNVNINHFQVTLDGDSDYHDSTRLQRNGKGSFEKIWSNLLSYRAVKNNFTIIIRLHLTNQNLKSMLRLSQKIKLAFGNDHRYFINVEEIRPLGEGVKGANGGEHIPNSPGSMRAKIYELIGNMQLPGMTQKTPSQKKTTSLNLSKEKVDQENTNNPYICYAAMPRQLLIRPDGSLGKCTVMLYNDINHIGHLNEDGSLYIDKQKRKLWVQGFFELDSQGMACPATNISQPARSLDLITSDKAKIAK